MPAQKTIIGKNLLTTDKVQTPFGEVPALFSAVAGIHSKMPKYKEAS